MKPIGIYIHIPFCSNKCPYCDFYSVKNSKEYDRYTKELIKRISLFSEKYKRNVDTVYFGGGTPSVLGSDRLNEILNAVKSCFSLSSDNEITVEVNPTSALSLDFHKMRETGFNRLSVGLQSANDNELKILGRKHNTETVKEVLSLAREAKFDNISFDLMLCIPEQTKHSLAKSIQFCKDCGVEHISAYMLKIEENTPFFKIKDKLQLFDDDTQAQIYEYAVELLENAGYSQYEISNFSKCGYEGKHNLKYWHDEEYLGIGPSAHSFIDKKRFFYGRSIKDFYENIIIADGDGGDLSEYIILNLRLKEGLNLENTTKKYPTFAMTNELKTCLKTLSKADLIYFDDNIIKLTVKGFLVSNSVISYILNCINSKI